MYLSNTFPSNSRNCEYMPNEGNCYFALYFLGGNYMNDTRMANFPKIQMHPSGKYFLYISYDSIKIETTQHKEVFNKHKDLRSCNYRFCAFSPDGKYVAILLSASKHFEMIISMLDSGFTFNDNDADLTRMLPKFLNSSRRSEHVECKWSPDSQHIAVCSSINFLFILNKKLEFLVDVTDSILPDQVFPNWSGTFDYDPRSCHKTLVVGTNTRQLYFINTGSQRIIVKSDTLSRSAIDSLVYHPQGHSVAVATRDFNIYLIDSIDAEIKYQLNMLFHVTVLTHNHQDLPAVIRLAFTSTGDQIASATSDGYVRVWQLPPNISLFELCKQAILSEVPHTLLHKLPLPSQIVSKLLSMPNMF